MANSQLLEKSQSLTESQSLMEYFTDLIYVGYKAGMIMGSSVAYPLGIISGLLLYKFILIITDNRVTTNKKHKGKGKG